MKVMKRMVHFDFHTQREIEDFSKNFNAKDIVGALKDANAEYVNFVARCNKGFSYYPTKVGITHPYLKYDLLGDMVKECHANGIGITAYVHGGLNHELLLRKPEYCIITKEGSSIIGDINENIHHYRKPCFNSGYRQYLLSEIREMLAYDPDGIFVDGLAPEKCYCPVCRGKMAQLGIDIEDDNAVFKYAYDLLKEVMEEMRSIIPDDKRVFLKYCAPEEISNLNTHGELVCLPVDGCGYEFFMAQAPYYRNLSDDVLYMAGCFVDGWGDFGGKKEVVSFENDVYDALVYGFSPALADHINPRDGLDRQFYKAVGKSYSLVKELEKWTEGTKIFAEVGVLRHKITHKNMLTVDDADSGIARMLSELKICFDIINEDFDFSKYKLLILPENIEITDKLEEKLNAFEGAVISCGKSIKKGGIWSYIDEYGDDSKTYGYYNWNNSVYGMYNCGIRMKSKYSLSDHIEPYFNRGFYDDHYHFYIPPKNCDGYCAVASKDRYAHICFDVFSAYLQHGGIFHKNLVNDLITRLMGERKIETSLPSTSRVSLATGKNELLHVKVTMPEIRGTRGIIEEHITVPAGHTVAVAREYKSVRTLPEMKKVKIKRKDGKTYITLPEITGYKAFLLQK